MRKVASRPRGPGPQRGRHPAPGTVGPHHCPALQLLPRCRLHHGPCGACSSPLAVTIKEGRLYPQARCTVLCLVLVRALHGMLLPRWILCLMLCSCHYC